MWFCLFSLRGEIIHFFRTFGLAPPRYISLSAQNTYTKPILLLFTYVCLLILVILKLIHDIQSMTSVSVPLKYTQSIERGEESIKYTWSGVILVQDKVNL